VAIDEEVLAKALARRMADGSHARVMRRVIRNSYATQGRTIGAP
jgi:hypothetical protein